ncbi:uncharacterized protein [Elaeis guineensis]|uniref:Uncharacterized protein LOC105035131 isoform X3 n=1 Tax=Elaeis guineensis var. tenera TaxID=51953 RepID=A0A6J0PD20_ELAGV|nr:uncharacterized protein LOC105035131 isoform X3 [Elaeis guineensis]XP_029117684.1 uncharacterized protein LOC105035131 isoform X3 [Elaeis guineensis]XP_029117685.1 uncharacterized protein LOC105035131 isoform X3 [Elaeis guineensis]
MTEDEVARTCPPNVYPHQWIELVHYWFLERGQMEEYGREPGEVEFYRVTRTHQDGSFVREEFRELIDRATMLIAERTDESSSSTECSRIEAQVFTELMGSERYGRVRDYGVEVTSIQLSAMSRYTQECRQNDSTTEVRRLEMQLQEMSQRHDLQMEELRQSHQIEIVSLRTQVDQIISFFHGFAPHQGPDTSSSCRDGDTMHKCSKFWCYGVLPN